MDCQREEWNKFITMWDASVYERRMKGLPFSEKVATLFRGKVKKRQDVMISLLGHRIKGGQFFEFGCGCGRLGELLLEHGAIHYTGVDVSSEGLEKARLRLSRFDPSKFNLYCKDIGEMKNIKGDAQLIYCGLGIIQYLSEEELRTMFKIIGEARFIFEAHELQLDIANLMFLVYRIFRRHSYYRFVKTSEIRKAMNNPERLQYKRMQGLSFVSYL